MTYEILSNAQMRQADALTIEGGTPGYSLMERAGQGLAEMIARHYSGRSLLFLCGPGNNGGDGFVAARLLKDQGEKVRLACMVRPEELRGDAAKAAQAWKGDVLSLQDLEIREDEVIIDALFGTGFSRSFEAPVADLLAKIGTQGHDVVAVDIPSGIHGDSGQTEPQTLRAAYTVTFFRKKLGHVLMPGAACCGEIHVVDIGIHSEVLAQTGFSAKENDPSLWRGHISRKTPDSHKYDYGHAVILGGPQMTGAATLAACAAMRMGAGLCTIAGDPKTSDLYRREQPHVLFEPLAQTADFRGHIADERRNALLLGPGAGLADAEELRAAVKDSCVRTGKSVVLDADALTAFTDNPEELFGVLGPHCILTPHEGEFSRIFPDLEGSKLERAKQAADLSSAVILLKGADTVIAAPDGRAVINTHSAPELATAGAGDVLAGMILGLLARGVPVFDAACAAVWMHGEAAQLFGPGLTAPDIIAQIPAILRKFS